MDKVTIVCSDNGKSKTADVLSQSSKYMKVVIEGTTMTVELSRHDVNKPYVGTKAGLEFTYAD
tara:strand:- start:587 stop:775 length:189 start_codon:yes stop_codon:yes gene_type:complete